MMRYAYYNVGSHWALWILMSLAMLVFWGILAWAVVSIARHKNAHSDCKSQPGPGTGSDALASSMSCPRQDGIRRVLPATRPLQRKRPSRRTDNGDADR